MRTFLFFLFGLLLLQVSSFAQKPDTVQLAETKIESSSIKKSLSGVIHHKIESDESDRIFTNQIGELLQANAGLVIRLNNYGGSSSLSIRGSNASQVAVSWNGFNINSPSLGSSDISLLPPEIANDITLYSSGMSPHSGQSGLGGMLEMNFDPELLMENQIDLKTGIGSFDTYNVKLRCAVSGSVVKSETQIFFNGSENKYPFTNTTLPGDPTETLNHGAFSSPGIVQQFSIRTGRQSRIRGGLWYQQYYREIPALMTVPTSNAVQRDSSLKTYLRYDKISSKVLTSIGLAYFDDYQSYVDPDALIDSRHRNRQYQADAAVSNNDTSRFYFKVGVKPELQMSDIEEYGSPKQVKFLSVYSNLKFQVNRGTRITTSIRKVFSDHFRIPFTFSAGITQNIYKYKFLAYLNGGYHYRVPTLNDRYWVPGGNRDLVPESSKNIELNFRYVTGKNFSSEIVAGTYYRLTDNWIQWTPQNSGIWTPVNVKLVESSGFNFNINLRCQFTKVHRVEGKFGYVYTRAINRGVESKSLQSTEDKQLLFTPEHSGSGIFQWKIIDWSLSLRSVFVGERPTVEDNSRYLPFYTVSDVSLAKDFTTRKISIIASARINNIMDSEYTFIPYSPMRGRWYQVGLALKFKTNNI